MQEIQNKKTENNNNKKQRPNLDSGAFRPRVIIYANKKKLNLARLQNILDFFLAVEKRRKRPGNRIYGLVKNL